MSTNNKNKPIVTKYIIKSYEKIIFCRCWKSKKFPFCDGSHRKDTIKENKNIDNMGPIIIYGEKCI